MKKDHLFRSYLNALVERQRRSPRSLEAIAAEVELAIQVVHQLTPDAIPGIIAQMVAELANNKVIGNQVVPRPAKRKGKHK